jgi:hypothetical protein
MALAPAGRLEAISEEDDPDPYQPSAEERDLLALPTKAA